MTTHRRLLAGTLGLAVGLAACGATSSSPSGEVAGESATPVTESVAPAASPSAAASADTGTSASPSASASAGTSPSASGSPGASASAGASGSPGASASAGTGAVPTMAPGPAADLAALLPDEAGGVTFAKRGLSGTEVPQSAFNLDMARLTPVLEANGKTIEDVTVAVATPADLASGATVLVTALRIDGVDAAQVADATSLNVDAMEQATMAGKPVWLAGSEAFRTVVYATGDTAFQVMFADQATAEAIVAALP
jgi:hypothetical protein